MKKKNIAIGVVGLTLLGTTVAGFAGWYAEHGRVAELESQVAELQLTEKRSAVVRSISKQMEEIAYQQREISDEQREEAIQQKKVADEMRLRSEVERQNALIARHEAEVSAQQAQEARLIAEDERLMAEHQRIQAEFSKRVADTLSYIALGRSLGNIATVQAQVGNTELSDLLTYASYYYINKYEGDVYYPSVFQALMTSSMSNRSWPCHNGSVMGMGYLNDDQSMVTVSSYGEIMLNKRVDNQLDSKILFSDKNFDFRSVYVDEKDIVYAVSREGQLVIIDKGSTRIIPIDNLVHPQDISFLDEHSLLLIGEHGLAVYDKEKNVIVAIRELDSNIITSFKLYNNKPMLFDNQGHQHAVIDINNLNTSPIPVKGRVTAFAGSKNTRVQAYGMSDGTIYLYDEKNNGITKLEGHLSRISSLKFDGRRLYSASYDGSVKLWNTSSEKIEPITLFSTSSWIMCFKVDKTKQHAWMGAREGNIIEGLLSVPMMVDIVRNKLKRDLTREEWNYYIGDKIPYESFISEHGKEVIP